MEYRAVDRRCITMTGRKLANITIALYCTAIQNGIAQQSSLSEDGGG
jgi:hypothetical protein